MDNKKKLGRNDPCHCGSGKKYKHCHLEQDREQARREQLTPVSALSSPSVSPPLSELEEAGEELELSPEVEEEDARWEQFEAASLNGKTELFKETLTEGQLDAEEAFEMLTTIREEMDTVHNPQSRALYAELVGRLRDEAPELYQHDVPYYHSNLIDDAITEMHWESIPELLSPFAINPESDIDIFFNIIDSLLYHGQVQTLIDAMGQAWGKVMGSDDITPWGIDEFRGKLISLLFFNYLETAETPRADDAALLEAVAPYGELDSEWIETAIRHLSASTPMPWQEEDFGESVDAETWQNNVGVLLLDFMADQKNRSGVPFSRSEFARVFLSSLLYEQMTGVQGQQRRSGRGRRSNRRGSRSQLSAPNQSPLVPTYEALDKSLAELFGFLNLQLYKAGAVVELLPAYLHFLARLNLIHPTEMDAALEKLRAIASSMITLLERTASEPHLVEAVKSAWSDDRLASLRDDKDLAEARSKPAVQRAAKPPKSTKKPGALQTYTFKVTYEYDRDVWRKIEIAENQTLDDLHSAIIDSVDFADDHLYSFFLSGRAWDKSTEYASPYADGANAARMKIKDLRLRMKQKFLYLFDYGDEHRFEVQLTEINPDASKKTRYPRIVEKHGEAPSQYEEWDDEDWEDEELD
ncbi:MAG: SEC-C metal-binding domain-containing protein [Candidatus Poribacteria bacterium]